MKPRTRLQKKVAELSGQLPELSDEQRIWAEEHCFKKTGYLVRKDRVWCHECGSEFKAEITPLAADLGISEAVCPVCGKRIKVTQCRKHEHKEDVYFTILTTMGGMQVCRHFEVSKRCRRGEGCARYGIGEAVQNWINEKGEEVIVARPIVNNLFYCTWNYSGPLSVKVAGSYYCDMGLYYINAYHTYPKREILPILRRNGYDARFQRIAPNELFKELLTDCYFETLMKAKRFDFAEYRYNHNGIGTRAMKIAIRHGYYPKDVGMWFDYINMSEDMGLDVYNPHYLCPRNLAEAHDRILKKLQEKRAREKKLSEMALAAKYEAEYAKDKGRYFGICFGDEKIVITVIKSVAEMAEEGSAMHHCVYDMRYYTKASSLILSAKDREGKRIETVEVNLKTYEVVQSRGVCNQNTKYHNEIISLVKNNMNLIRTAV